MKKSIQYTGLNLAELLKFINGVQPLKKIDGILYLITIDYMDRQVNVTDWIIKDINGSFFLVSNKAYINSFQHLQ